MITYSPGSILSYPDCFYVDYIKSTEGDPGGGEPKSIGVMGREVRGCTVRVPDGD
jgi:hypothetical protein